MFIITLGEEEINLPLAREYWWADRSKIPRDDQAKTSLAHAPNQLSLRIFVCVGALSARSSSPMTPPMSIAVNMVPKFI